MCKLLVNVSALTRRQQRIASQCNDHSLRLSGGHHTSG
jgi:hypothetical protein